MIKLTDIGFEDNNFVWKLNGIPFKIKYYFNINRKYFDVFKLIPLIQTACLISTYKDKVKVNIEGLTKHEEQFLIAYIKKQYVLNMFLLDILIKSNHPKVKISGSDVFKRYKGINTFKLLESSSERKFEPKENGLKLRLKPKKVVVAWSGGKDALLTMCLLNEIGVKAIPCTTRWNTIAFNCGTKPFLDKHKIKPNYVASIALGSKMKKLFIEALDEQKIEYTTSNRSGLFMQKKEIPFMLYWSFYMIVQIINNMLYALHNNVKYVFAGDEADLNGVHDYFGFKLYDNIGQSHDFKILLNRYINSIINQPVRSYSLLYPLRAPLELRILIERYKRTDFSSCLTSINTYCQRCPKCLTLLLQLSALGYNPNIVGLSKERVLKNFKDDMAWSAQLPSTEMTIWITKQCIKNKIANNKGFNRILVELLDGDETPKSDNFNPLIPIKSEYKTIPNAIRREVGDIYDEYSKGII